MTKQHPGTESALQARQVFHTKVGFPATDWLSPVMRRWLSLLWIASTWRDMMRRRFLVSLTQLFWCSVVVIQPCGAQWSPVTSVKMIVLFLLVLASWTAVTQSGAQFKCVSGCIYSAAALYVTAYVLLKVHLLQLCPLLLMTFMESGRMFVGRWEKQQRSFCVL